MARLIHPDGTSKVVRPADPVAGFSLAELYSMLNCTTVQAVPVGNGLTMWMDEEAKLKEGLQFVNVKATQLLAEAGGIPGDEVIGSILITRPGEVT